MTIGFKDEQGLRLLFKIINKFMVLMWRLGLGKILNFFPTTLGTYMIITHTGRKSNKKYLTPVNYTIIEDTIYCTAGFGSISDWYRNIIANPNIEVWLPPNYWWSAIAQEVENEKIRLPILKQIITNSGFAARMMGIDIENFSDDQLELATVNYRLIKINRAQALTGEGGPGEYAWMWFITTLFLLPIALFRVRRRK